MSKSVSNKELVGIVVGAVGGLLLQSAVVTAIVGLPYLTLITKWGRYGVSIALVALFCAFYKTMSRTQALITSLVSGVIIPSLLSKFVFGSGAPWINLFVFNLLFSIIALVIFRVISKQK